MNQCGTPAGRSGWSWARCRTGTLRVCAGMLALAALGAVPALAQDVERAPSAVLLDTTLTVGQYSAPSFTFYGYHANASAVGLTVDTAGALADRTFVYNGAEYTITRLTTGDNTRNGNGFIAETSTGEALPHGDDLVGDLGLELSSGGTAILVRLQEERRGLDAVGLGFHAFSLTTGATVRVRLIDLGPPAYLRTTVDPSGVEPGLRGYWIDGTGTAHGTAAPAAFELAGVTYTVDRIATISIVDNVLQFATTPDLPPGLATLALAPRSARGGTSGEPRQEGAPVLTAALHSSAPGVDYVVPEARFEDPPETGPWRVYLYPAPDATATDAPPQEVDVLWSADLTVADGAHGVTRGYGRGFGALSGARVSFPDASLDFSVGRLGFTSTSSALYNRLELQTSRPVLPAHGREGLGLEVSGDDGTHVYWLGRAEILESTTAGHPYAFRWAPTDTGHAWAVGDVRRVRMVRVPVASHPRLTLSPPAAPEGRRVQVEAAVVLDSLPFAVETTWGLLRPAPDEMRQRAEAVDYDLPAPSGLATLAAGERRATFDVDLNLRDDEVVEAAEDLLFEACRATVQPTDESDCDGPVLGRDFLILDGDAPEDILYWDATLTPAASEDVVWFVGYLVTTDTPPVIEGALSTTEFACCRGRQSTETAWTVNALGRSATGERVRWWTDQALFDADDHLVDALRGAVLHIGERTFPLDDGMQGQILETPGGRTLGLLDDIVREMDLAYETHRVDHEVLTPGKPVRVRLTGPRHPKPNRLTDVASPGRAMFLRVTLGEGEWIEILVVFDEAVLVTGTPALEFGMGAQDRQAEYVRGSGTNAVTFAYQVQRADTDADGIDVPLNLSEDSIVIEAGESIVSLAHGRKAVFPGDGARVQASFLVVDGSATKPAAPGARMSAGSTLEGAGEVVFTVALSFAPDTPMTFEYRTDVAFFEPATAGVDYMESRGMVTVPAGEREVSFTVRIIDDDLDEPDERIRVVLTREGAQVDALTAEIIDDDPTVVRLSPSDAAVGDVLFENEAAGTSGAWTLTRDLGEWRVDLLDELTVFLNVNPGTAAVDMSGRQTVTFEAGATELAFSPITTDDAVREPSGRVTVSLVAAPDYVVDGPAQDAVELRDDDGALLSLRFEPAALTVAEGASARVFVVAEPLPERAAGTFVSLTDPADVPRALGPHYSMGYVPVNVSTPPGTATKNTDYTGTEPAIDTIRLDGFRATPEGGLILHRAAPPIETTADSVTDDGETFSVLFDDLVDADGRVVLADRSESTVTISEGATLALEFSATDAMIAEGDDAASAGSTTVTATASMARTTAWTVEISAQSAHDARWEFADANRTLTFASNQTTSTGVVTIRAVPNDLDEPDLEVTVRGTPEASTGLPSASAILTLTDDDLPKVSIAAPKLARETGHVFESEAAHASDRDGWWVLTRARVTDEELTVNLSVSETDGDVVEADKESTTQTVKFGAGKATTSYSPITNDEVDKVHGNVTVTVEPGTDYEVAPDGASASALVRDDDGTLVSFAITPAALSVSEGQTRTLSIVSQTVQDMTFTSLRDLLRVFFEATAMATVSVAATTTGSTDDYAVPTDSVLFEFSGYMDDGLGGLRATVSLSFEAKEDTADDGGETVTVMIGLTAKADADRVVLGTPMASVVTLRDGPVLTLSVTPSDLEIAEGATATVTASVDPVHDAAFTATVAGMSDDDARWEFVGGTTLMFDASQAAATGSVTIRAIGNDIDDGHLDITLTGTSSVTEVAPPAPVVLTVLDDDLPQVSIAAPTDAQNTGHVFEHEAADTTDANWVWALTRVGLTVEPLTVNLSVDDTGTFTDGAAATATFGAGASNVRYTPVTNDTADEGHGTVTVTVDAGTDYEVDPDAASAMAAVRDDDGPLLEVSIDAAVTVPEGMAAVFGAKAENSDGTLTVARDLERLFSGLTAVTVNAQSADGSAMAASDYTALDGSVALDTFEVTAEGGRWTGNVSVQTTEDMVTEGSQDFTVTLSLPAGTDARIALKSGDETGTATIVEGPALTLSVAPEELAEGATATVTASVEPTHDAAFTVAVAGMSDDDRALGVRGQRDHADVRGEPGGPDRFRDHPRHPPTTSTRSTSRSR